MNPPFCPHITPTVALTEAPFLRGLQKDFQNTAQILVTRAREMPERPYVLFHGQTITYARMNQRANRVAHFLREKGVVRGDIVSILMPNAPEIYDVMFGAQKLGAVVSLFNFTFKGQEIAYLVDDSRPKIIFAAPSCLPELQKALSAAVHRPEVVEVLADDDHPQHARAWSKIMDRFPEDEALVAQSEDDPFLLLYSSGTTGHPKGIVLTHAGQLSICRDMARLGLVSGNDVMLLMLPMFHVNPICVWTFPMLFCGQTLCLRKGFSPADFWPSITENGVTIVMGVPAMYAYVYYRVDPNTIDRARLKLRYAFCGAAPLALELIHAFKDRFGVDIIEGYGLTEGTGVAMANPPLGRRKAGSAGLPLPEQQVSILDSQGQPLAAGQRGEICIKGPAVMRQYRNNPAATAQTVVDGWLRTGDVGSMDSEGYFTIVDRIKDMINRGGENIYPKEIEEVLAGHPDIVEAAVIGVPDPALGERVKAVVQTSRPGVLTQQDVIAYLTERVSRLKVPEFVEITDALPRSATGKVLKHRLRERTAGGSA